MLIKPVLLSRYFKPFIDLSGRVLVSEVTDIHPLARNRLLDHDMREAAKLVEKRGRDDYLALLCS